MIELQLSEKPVKWQDNGTWFTGRVLHDEHGPAVHMTEKSDGLYYLVRCSNTNRVFSVLSSRLIVNTCREDERAAEAARAVVNRLDECIERLSALAGDSLDARIFMHTAKDYSQHYHAGRIGIDSVSSLVDEIEDVFSKDFSSSKEAEAANE